MRFKKGVLSMLLAMPVLSTPLLAVPPAVQGQAQVQPVQQQQGQRQQQAPVQPVQQQQGQRQQQDQRQQTQQQDQRQQQQAPQRQQDQGGKGTQSQDQQWAHFERSVNQMRNRCNELQRQRDGKDRGIGSQLAPFQGYISCGGLYQVMERSPHTIPFPSRTQLITDFSSNKHNSSTADWLFAERGTAAKCTIVSRTTHETRGDVVIPVSDKDCEKLYADKIVTLCRDEVVNRCTEGDCEQARGTSSDTCVDLERAKRG